jgi:hypothetical protein
VSRLLCLLAVALTCVANYPIIGNYFFADDFLNLYHIVNDPLPQYLVTPNGGHVLLARNAVFYLCWRFFGTRAAGYFWTVLLTHLLNVALAFRAMRALTGSALLASLGAALWGTSPLNAGTLGWYSVYGQVLVVTAVLLILDGALRAGTTGEPPSRVMLAWWYALALIAASSFGIGTAIALVLPGVLALLLPAGRRVRPRLLSLVVVVPLLYVAQTWAYERLSDVDLHITTSVGLLLSDARSILEFGVGLVGFGLTGLLAGPFVSASPVVWYAVLATFAAVVAAAVASASGSARSRLLACVVLVVTAYGIIALGRGMLATALMKSPIDAVLFVPRYHYAGQLFLTLLLTATVARLAAVRAEWLAIVLGACYAAAIIANVGWSPSIDHHAEAREQTNEIVREIRSAIAAVPPGGTVRITNGPFNPLPFSPTLFPGWVATFTIFFPEDVVDGRHVYFVESNPDVREALRRGRRTSALVVAP